MKSKNTNKLVFAIVAVLLIIAIVGGSTFAYFQWTTADSQKTNINVTIEAGGITMHIEPEKSVFDELKPTAYCNKYDDNTGSNPNTNGVTGEHPYAAMYADALVTIVNNTGTLALPSFKLSAKVTKGGSDALDSAALGYIHYAVAAVTTTKDGEGNAVKGAVSGGCTAPLTANDVNDNTIFTNTELIATGTFATVSTSGAWTDLPTGGSDYLPRQYDASTGEISGVTFKAEQYATTHQYYRVFVWIDNGYTTTTVGDTVSDPLQDAKIEITWSANSMVQQVAA